MFAIQNTTDYWRQNARNEKRKQDRRVTRLLTKARDLLIGPNQDGAGWTKNAFARNSAGTAVSTYSTEATCFCTRGAMERAQRDLDMGYADRYEAERRIFNVMVNADKCEDIEDVNDRKRTIFPQVLIAFDLAVAGAGK